MSFEFCPEYVFEEEPLVRISDILMPIDGNLDNIASSPQYPEEDFLSEDPVAQYTPSLYASPSKGKPRAALKKLQERHLEKERLPKRPLRKKKVRWTVEEDEMIVEFFMYYGGNWKLIANLMKNRPADVIKNRFYGTLKKKLTSRQNRIISNMKNGNSVDTFETIIDQSERFKHLSGSFNSDVCRNRWTQEEKQKKVQKLYSQMVAIQAFIAKTQDEINNLKPC